MADPKDWREIYEAVQLALDQNPHDDKERRRWRKPSGPLWVLEQGTRKPRIQ